MKWFVGIFVILLVGLFFIRMPLYMILVNMREITKFEVVGDQLIMNDEINSQTLKQFNKIIAENPEIKTLVEGQVPGSNDDDTMIALAYRVRELGLNTHLNSDSAIYSGGVDLFLAGVERTMEKGAVIGVHSWSDGFKTAIEYSREAPEHEQNRKYIEDMIGDDSFYWFTIEAAPFDSILEMTAEDIKKYGLITKGYPKE